MIGLDLSSKGQVHESFNAALMQYRFIETLYCLQSHKKCLQQFPNVETSAIHGVPDWIAYFRVIKLILAFLIILKHFKKRIVFLTIEVEHFSLLPFLGLIGTQIVFFSHSLPMRYAASSRTRKFLQVVFFFLTKTDKHSTICIVHKFASFDCHFVKEFASSVFDVRYISHPIATCFIQSSKNRRLNTKRRVLFLGTARVGKGFERFQSLSETISSCEFVHAFDSGNKNSGVPSRTGSEIKNLLISGPLADNIMPEDIVFNMHDKNIYDTVPSGVFFDAISARAWILQHTNTNVDEIHRKFFRIVDLGNDLELLKQKGKTFSVFVEKEYQGLKAELCYV